jgi:hypothetical protein
MTLVPPGCCGLSINQRLSSQPEFQKPYDPTAAGNCSTCRSFGAINDIGALPEIALGSENVVVARLTRSDFS